ncbi:nucleoside hydrolase [soil metagenome]
MTPFSAIKKIFLFAFFCLAIQLTQAQPKQIPTVIFDTDMGPDYDDVGAITLLHAFADSGKVNILATIASTKYEGVAAVINVLNTYFKRPNIPIGVPKEKAITQKDWQHWTDTLIEKYPHAIKNNSEVADAVTLYREILTAQPDNSVTIITVGFLTNISNLLQSNPDKYSNLNGRDLVNKKVKKLICMAAKFPGGYEFNIKEDAGASRYAFDHWPKPVLFSGFEIGQKIKTGLPLIANDAIKNSPVKDVFRIAIPMAKEDSAGRMSWDETAVLVAVLGYQPFYKLITGQIVINEDGSNAWINEGTKQAYLIEDKPSSEVQDLINKLLMHQPK